MTQKLQVRTVSDLIEDWCLVRACRKKEYKDEAEGRRQAKVEGDAEAKIAEALRHYGGSVRRGRMVLTTGLPPRTSGVFVLYPHTFPEADTLEWPPPPPPVPEKVAGFISEWEMER